VDPLAITSKSEGGPGTATNSDSCAKKVYYMINARFNNIAINLVRAK